MSAVIKNGGYLYILVNDQQTLPQIRKILSKNLLIEYVDSINKLMFDLPMPNNAQQLERWAKKSGIKKLSSNFKKTRILFHRLESGRKICYLNRCFGWL